MNNADQPFVSVPLELLGGLYTEATPESLPLGASPLVINCDFILGAVLQRPGKQNVFYFGSLFVENLPNSAASIPGPNTPNEQAWTNPTNATKNIPGTYAEVQLNETTVAQAGIGAFDTKATGQGSTTTSVSTASATPSGPGEFAIFLCCSFFTMTPAAGWTNYNSIAPGNLVEQIVSASIAGSGTLSSSGQFAAAVMLFKLLGSLPPTIVANESIVSGSLSAGIYHHTVTQPVPANATILIYSVSFTGGQCNFTASDAAGNLYTNIAAANSGNAIQDSAVNIWMAQNVPANAALQVTATVTSGSAGGTLYVLVVQGGIAGANTPGFGQILEAQNFNMNVPSTVNVLGLQVVIKGHQSTQNSDAILTVSVGNLAGQSTQTFAVQLPSVDGTVTVGLPLSNWGFTLTPALLNDPNFNVQILPSATTSPVIFDIYAIELLAWITPNPPPNFNYIKTFAETGGEVLTLALGSDGIMYQEDAINNPGVLTAAFTEFEPNSYGQSATVDDREFIAISNLQNGTDMPRTYSPPNFDRLSQVGPGLPPSASSSASANTIVSITQPTVKSDVVNPGHLSGILWSAGPGSVEAGNVLTVYYNGTNNLAVADPDLQIGNGVQLAAINPASFNGQTVNGIYQITSTGQGVPPGAAQSRWYFTVTMPTTQFVNQANHIEPNAPSGTYQVTVATLTASSQVPNLEVGGTLNISGTGGAPTAGYDGGWTVLTTPNAAQLLITSTVLAGNVATYGYTLISGTNPVVGQLITVTGTLNGNGIFNKTNVAISSASPGSFSIPLFDANVSAAAENGSGIVFGTIFTFDPMQIVGNKFGGSIVTTGTISAGIRKVCYSFLTRNGFMTQPSPIATFDVTSGASFLVITGLLTGPPNVIARVIHLTAANGGNFYNIPEPVPVISNGVTVTNSSTWVNDNITTTISLSFSDGVLLAADEIDIEGNNLFENFELGSCVALIPYSQRIFAVGEQNKVFNLLNCSFDGGVGGGAGSTASVPAGWTVDPTNGAGGSVINSPLFGFAFQISNTTGSTQAIYGMITQPAFEDEFLVPIIEASTTYSVRVTLSVPTGTPASGNLVVDLFSPSFNKSFGTFTLALNSVGTSMQIFSGTMLLTGLAPVPSDLLIRIYATAILNGTQIQIDRVEPFPTEAPNLNTQIIGSYSQAFEQFDRVTGVVLANQQNQQPVVTAFTLFGSLFIVKTGSFVSVADNNTTEPAQWTIPRVVSNSVGAFGVYSVSTGIDDPNSGEEWALIGGRAGLFIFAGGQPIKLSEEIQAVWNQINMAFAYTVWVRNDVTNRRILVGVPLKALNAAGNTPTWLPAGLLTDNNPQTPNVVLELNYKQINTSSELSGSVQIHRSYSGKLIASDIVRKWSIWTVKAPCAAFIQRADNSLPLFVGNSDHTGKIYDLVDGLMQDDGAAINQIYYTAGFVTSETGQGTQMGVMRYFYEYMSILFDGQGPVVITVYPNTLDTGYSNVLLPNLTLPASSDGDVEVPVQEAGSRLFVSFQANAVGTEFEVSRLVMVMTKHPWSPVRGVNNE